MVKNTYNKKAIISPNIRLRYPKQFDIGDYSVIDDFCYISVDACIGKYFHIASNVTIAGGNRACFTAGNFGGISSGCRLFCSSDDFVNDIGNVLPKQCTNIKTHTLRGGIYLNDFVTIGANSVIMPKIEIPKGTVIGAMSFVPSNFKFESWSVYCMKNGKLTKIKDRNEKNVRAQAKRILEIMK